jgi:hypothetical protein
MKKFLALAAATGIAAFALAQTPEKHDASVHQPPEIKWQQGPAALPPGANGQRDR